MITLPVAKLQSGDAAKIDRLGDLGRIGYPPHMRKRSPAQALGFRVRRLQHRLLHHVGCNRAWTHAERADLRREFDGQGLGQSDDRPFGCAIGDASGIAEHAGIRTNIDDHALRCRKTGNNPRDNRHGAVVLTAMVRSQSASLAVAIGMSS